MSAPERELRDPTLPGERSRSSPSRPRLAGRCPFCSRVVALRVSGRLGSHTIPVPEPGLLSDCMGVDSEPVIGSVRYRGGGA